jgi:hypothetical protein
MLGRNPLATLTPGNDPRLARPYPTDSIFVAEDERED